MKIPELSSTQTPGPEASARRDQEVIIRLLEQRGETLLAQGEIGQAGQWLNQLATRDVADHPWLSVLAAWCAILTGDLHRSRHFTSWAEQARTMAVTDRFNDGVSGHLAALKAIQLFFLSHSKQAAEQATVTLKQLQYDNGWVKSTLLFIQAYGLFQSGQFQATQQTLRLAETTGLKSDNFYVTLLAQCLQSRLSRMQGQLQQAQQIIHSARQLGHRVKPENTSLLAVIQVEQSRIFFERYQLQEALTQLTATPGLLDLISEPESRLTAMILLARLKLEMGDQQGAILTTAEATQFAETIGYEDNFAELSGQQAVMALIKGDIAACRNKLPALSVLQQSVEARHFIATLIYSSLLLYEKRHQESYALVQPWFEMSEREGLWGWYIEFGLQRVQALQAKEPEQALATLEDLIQWARPERLLRPFAQRRRRLIALSAGLSPEARAFLQSGGQPTPVSTPLSRREQDVLTLVAQGQSNQELAAVLHISLGTVKTHLHHILKKLEVDNRTAAVAAARRQGLL